MAVTGAHELRLLAPSPHDAQLVKLVAAYAGLLDDLTVVDGQKELQLLTADGGTLRGSNTICRHIAKHGPTGKALLGANADEDALVQTSRTPHAVITCQLPNQEANMQPDRPQLLQVAQWLSARYSMLSPINEEGLQQLDDALLTRTFLLGTSLSLADLVLFGVLHKAVVRPPVELINHWVSLPRAPDAAAAFCMPSLQPPMAWPEPHSCKS